MALFYLLCTLLPHLLLAQFAYKTYSAEDCHHCINNDRISYYCTKYFQAPQTRLNSEEAIGYCCDKLSIFPVGSNCDRANLQCSTEMENTQYRQFKYGLCPQRSNICGSDSRDVFLTNEIQKLRTGHMDTTSSCMWRFIAASLVDMQTKMMKIRVTSSNKVKIYASIL